MDFTSHNSIFSVKKSPKDKLSDRNSCNSDLTSPSKNFKQDNEEAIGFDKDHNIQITVKKLKEPFLERKRGDWISKDNRDHYKRFINLVNFILYVFNREQEIQMK